MARGIKLIYALWGDRSGADALTGTFRDQLAGKGARRVQVNVDDDAVAAAQLRTSTGPSPIRAVMSVWTDGSPDDITTALRDLDPTAAGWRVEERLPIAPPATSDGQRTDGLANIAFLRRPDELDQDAWLERWIGRHTNVAIETQATFGYVQNVVTEAVTQNAPPVAGIVEELFPMAAMTDWHAHYGTGGDEEELARRMAQMAESCDRFGATRGINVVPTSRYVHHLA